MKKLKTTFKCSDPNALEAFKMFGEMIFPHITHTLVDPNTLITEGGANMEIYGDVPDGVQTDVDPMLEDLKKSFEEEGHTLEYTKEIFTVQ